MAKKHTIDKLNEALFAGKADKLTQTEQNMLTRYQSAFTMWIDKPFMRDVEIRNYLIDFHNISQAQAYRDITNLKLLLGNVPKATREFQQYKVNDLLDRAIEAAYNGDHKLAKSLTNIAKELTRANRLNLIEAENINWEELIPQNFEPTSDPTSIGLKPIPNLKNRIAELKRKYADDIPETNYVDIIDDNAN